MEAGFGTSVTGCLLFVLFSLFFWWFWKTRRIFQRIEKLGLPGPRPSFLIGNMKYMTSRGFGAAFKDWEKEYGPIYGIYRAKQASIVIHDPEMLREIMVKQFDFFPNRMKISITDKKPLRNMLQITRDDHWRHVRKALSPGFSSGRLKSMLPIIQRSCRHLTTRAGQLAESGQEVDIKEMSNAYSMEVTAGTGFGLEVNCLQSPKEHFGQVAQRILYPPKWKFTFLFLFPALFDALGKLGLTIFPAKDTAYMTDVIRAALRERRQDKEQKYKDYLQCMVDAMREEGVGGGEGEERQDRQEEKKEKEEITQSTELDAPGLKTASSWSRKGLTQEEVEANSLTFLLAGYENTATAMAFLLYNLAGHPHCLQTLQHEVDSVLGQAEVDYRVVSDMPYLDMCLNESLRLYPPGILLDRECAEDTQVKGLHVPRGMVITIPVYSIHTDPANWPDPFTFDPERHKAEVRAQRHPFSFLPFGTGPRNCIGMRMSQMEVKMAVAAIVQKFSPVLCEKSVFPAQISNHIRLGPVDTMWVKFHPRSA